MLSPQPLVRFLWGETKRLEATEDTETTEIRNEIDDGINCKTLAFGLASG
jgi:hypothetical protein